MSHISATIVTIGDEILIGQIVDTNSAWIGELFNENGIKIEEIISISDSMNAIVSTLDKSLNDAAVTIVTGGLGPTKDDITKSAFCKLFDCKLKEDKETTEFLKGFLNKKGIIFNELNRSQAFIPEVCKALHNEHGTAPGMWAERRGNIIVSLPGVPFEMKPLMTNTVLPLLKKHFELSKITHRTLFTYGLPESELAKKIEDWENNLPENLHLAYLPNTNGVRLRLSDYDSDEIKATKDIDSAFKSLEPIIEDCIIGYKAATIEGALAQLLISTNKTLSVAESCTGGTISSRIVSLEGASTYYLGGVCSYSNTMKISVLGVSEDSIKEHGAVSEQVARQMAESIKRLTGSDYSIATTGIAGPTGGSAEKPVGIVWFAISTPEGTFCTKKVFGSLRTQNIERASSFGINMLRIHIRKTSAKIVF